MSAALPAAVIADAVTAAGVTSLPTEIAEQFSRYADLLLRWNARLNLTAIRTPGEILRRHFLECIFCAQHLAAGTGTVLDFGSGAGFPGIPIALIRPEIRVTLGESQTKKAAFLREAVRTLGIPAEVFHGRVEEMEPGRMFDVVALRAVDRMKEAIAAASVRVGPRGSLVLLTTEGLWEDVPGFGRAEVLAVPELERGVMAVFHVEHSAEDQASRMS